jgi:hypothetical protein
MYDPALHPEPLAHITSSSPAAAAHPECSGKSTVMLLLSTAVTVPTLEWVTAPHPYCGLDTDGSTCTRLQTCTCCEQLDEEEEMQAVAPVKSEYDPAGHKVHAEAPAPDEYVPAWHELHTVTPAQQTPASS